MQKLPELECVVVLLGVGLPVGNPISQRHIFVGPVVDGDCRASSRAAKPCQGFIRRDPCYPGRETRPLFKALQMQERFQKRVLHDILSILTRTCDVHCDSKDHGSVALREFV
jgi:hypothetical protein